LIQAANKRIRTVSIAANPQAVSISAINWRSWTPAVGLIAFCGLLFFLGLGDRDLTSSHEARAAQNAQTILDEGHWLVPRLFDRHLELQKPPLYYWLVALIAWLKGGPVDVWAVRLPAALSALSCVLFVYFLGVRSGRANVGLLAALILASSLHFTWLARVGRIDMPLTFAVTVALGAFHLGNLPDAARIRWHALGYTALGLGLLLKGPIAVILPVIVVAAVSLCNRYAQARRISEGLAPAIPRLRHGLVATRGWSLWWGIPLMLAIAAPWYIWANIRTDNQLWEVFFWYHNVERGLGGSETLKAHPFWFYLPQMGVDLLPWSVAVPFALYGLIRKRDDDAWSGLLWFSAMALFLSCMSFKRADYLLPAYPGVAIFLGIIMERWLGRCLQMSFVAVLAIYVIGWQVYNIALLPAEEKAWPYRAMAQEIRQLTDRPIIFFRAESHLLMHHVGQPVDTILEWENLQWWTARPFPVYVVMPEVCAHEWPQHLPPGTLQEVLRTSDYVHGKRDRPMIVLRTRPANP
jgi:4-amino-4-deoxy-L-arabinose transferase-like glycosyltransferase